MDGQPTFNVEETGFVTALKSAVLRVLAFFNTAACALIASKLVFKA